jgi:hypothetical protein
LIVFSLVPIAASGGWLSLYDLRSGKKESSIIPFPYHAQFEQSYDSNMFLCTAYNGMDAQHARSVVMMALHSVRRSSLVL